MENEIELGNIQNVPLNQVICTIQGEGLNIGSPSLLVRTNGCNLNCSFCDSKQTWLPSSSVFQLTANNLGRVKKEILNTINNLNYNIKCIILTGGEPSLHFDNIIYRAFVLKLCLDLDVDFVEIETNGSYTKFSQFDSFFKTITACCKKELIINISPKINSDIEIVKENILWCYRNQNNKLKFTIKIVNTPSLLEMVSSKLQPIISALDDVPIFIMPLTPYKSNGKVDKEQYIKNCRQCVEYCLLYGYRYTPREHIWIYDTPQEQFELHISNTSQSVATY